MARAKREKYYNVKCTIDEKAFIDGVADSQDEAPHSFVRNAALKEARAIYDGMFKEKKEKKIDVSKFGTFKAKKDELRRLKVKIRDKTEADNTKFYQDALEVLKEIEK
jgi:hypothetical protein